MKKRTRFAALLMAAALMLTLLAGCGGGPEGDQTTDEPGGDASGLVWVSEFTKVSGINDYISSPAISGDKIYVSRPQAPGRPASTPSTSPPARLPSSRAIPRSRRPRAMTTPMSA